MHFLCSNSGSTPSQFMDINILLFSGYEMQFDVGEKLSFEIPLMNVSQCTQGKDEVALEFHQHDDSELSLMEMRFYIPPAQDEYVDKVKVLLYFLL